MHTFVDVLTARATEHPDHLLYAFYEDGETLSETLSYGALYAQARSVASSLQSMGLSGERAILIFAPGLDFAVALMGCMLTRVVPVPAYPPEPHRLTHSLRRLHSIVKDAEASVLLTSEMILAFADGLISSTEHAGLKALNWLTVEQCRKSAASDWRRPDDLSPESLAFLQYTSGSTADPKGVMIRHRNLLANLEMLTEAYGLRALEPIIACWLPLYHDMGLLGNLLNAVLLGGQAHLMPPHAFLKNPRSWLSLISRTRATQTAAPNFAYDLVVRKVPEEAFGDLDLSAMRVFVNGAEPVRAETVERFTRHFAPTGLRRSAMAPSFGLAEVGLFATTSTSTTRPVVCAVDPVALEQGQLKPAEGNTPATTLVSSGKPWGQSEVVIVDPQTHLQCPLGRVGEIWLAGAHVAAGYWQRPVESAETFSARLSSDHEAGPFLRTGDLGAVLDDELFVTGRLKDLIIIRGRNLYPHDIEETMGTCRALHPEIRPGCSAAVSIEADEQSRLVVFQEIDERVSFDAEQTMARLREAVVQAHEISPFAVVLLARGALPKTSSGKVMRHQCQRAFAEGDLSELQVVATSKVARQRMSADEIVSRLQTDIAPLITEGAEKVAVLDTLRRIGLMRMTAPLDLGGLALEDEALLRVVAQLGAVDVSVAVDVVRENLALKGPKEASPQSASLMWSAALLGAGQRYFQRLVHEGTITWPEHQWLVDDPLMCHLLSETSAELEGVRAALDLFAERRASTEALDFGAPLLCQLAVATLRTAIERYPELPGTPGGHLRQALQALETDATISTERGLAECGRVLIEAKSTEQIPGHALLGSAWVERIVSGVDTARALSKAEPQLSALIELGRLYITAVVCSALSVETPRQDPHRLRALVFWKHCLSVSEASIGHVQTPDHTASARALIGLAKRYVTSLGDATSTNNPSEVPEVTDDVRALIDFVTAWLAQETDLLSSAGPQSLADTRLSALGLDSLTIVQLVGALEEHLERPIPQSLFTEDRTLSGLARVLLKSK
ncbi:MAG: AMP-binding protein [Bradymonadia bacterium]